MNKKFLGPRKKSLITKTNDISVDISSNPGKDLFYDILTDSYFESTDYEVLLGEYELNRLISINGQATVADYCEVFGIDCEPWYSKYGWSGRWVDFSNDVAVIDESMQCKILSPLDSPYFLPMREKII